MRLHGRVRCVRASAAINRKRKADQLAAAPVLAKLESDWVGLIKKNLEIEAACLKMEAANAANKPSEMEM